ncbi:trace amine-associated receptor 13c-like [Notolabrus celidotus]|uniref:trace amine-associated receptor 13c-like n=1 Tax=Notolabrus celidotus TaxID=1203425 RepID=UPI00148F80ED|nr:trace amine-associated receptor 13c-like [Notolabrus celidotus]
MMETLEGAELCFPQLLNSSCTKLQHPKSVSTLIYITLSVICVLTVTLNLLVIISISHYKQLQTPTNLLLLSLAVSDFSIGLLMMFQIALVEGCWYFGDQVCAFYFVLDYTFTSASIGTMVLISIDRYVAICHPLHYSSVLTHRKVDFSVSFCWTFSLLFHCVRFRNNLKYLGKFKSCVGECVVIIDQVSGFVDLIMSFLGPISVIVLLYLRVFAVAVSQARAMRTHLKSITLQCSVTVTAMRSEMKAARTLGVVVVVFLVCVCPYFCVALSGQGAALSTSSAAFIICLFYFNSCLNPLIYALFYPWFRKTIRLIFTLQILKPDSCEANIL